MNQPRDTSGNSDSVCALPAGTNATAGTAEAVTTPAPTYPDPFK
ncbi:MAG TPA: hypothetical protein VN224_01170 [Xanthomonadales bacterium]|nr:hypothetical protein [Xanthomonadales bacterium]